MKGWFWFALNWSHLIFSLFYLCKLEPQLPWQMIDLERPIGLDASCLFSLSIISLPPFKWSPSACKNTKILEIVNLLFYWFVLGDTQFLLPYWFSLPLKNTGNRLRPWLVNIGARKLTKSAGDQADNVWGSRKQAAVRGSTSDKRCSHIGTWISA